MKTVAILAAAAAIMAATSAYASMPETHEAGGPIKQGNYCWTATNNYGAGWWHNCGDFRQEPKSLARPNQIFSLDIPAPPPPRTAEAMAGTEDGSGDGGGDGGGGGGR
jgi:hypothetical protein